MSRQRHKQSTLSLLFFYTAVTIVSFAVGQLHQNERIQLPGASGSGPYEALVDWIAAFEAKYPEADFTLSSVGSGASQSALWGDIDCAEKPIEALCRSQQQSTETTTTTTTSNKAVWGMGGASFGSQDYTDHEELELQMLPAIGGPVIPVYSKDVTGDLGQDGDAGLNMTFDVMVGIFNGSITSWSDPSIADLNPNLNLPTEPITVLVRADTSGMTQTLTESMAASGSPWPEKSVGKLPDWPLHLTHANKGSTSCETNLAGIHSFKADGQTGIGLGLLRRPYSFGYLELGYFGQLTGFVSQVHMSSALHPDKFVPANADTISTTMDGLVDIMHQTTLEVKLSKQDTPLGGYPISRYVYWYVKKNYTEYTSCYQAWLLCTFLKWTYEDPLAKEIASKHGWIVPPASVVSMALEKLQEVQCLDDTKDSDNNKKGGKIISALDYQPAPYRIHLNQMDNIRPVGLVLSAIVLLTSVFFFCWVLYKRKNRIVKASQPVFLLMICFGTFFMGAAIIPLTIDDSITTVEGCDIACMSFPWLTCSGFTIAFTALFSKIWRVNKLFNAKRFRRVKVRKEDVLIPFAGMVTMNITFLFAWSITDPLKWKREMIDPVNSVGKCEMGGGLSLIFMMILVLINAIALILANFQAYRARGISDEFSESRYVAIAMAKILQVLLMGLPIVLLLKDNPPARLFVVAGIIFVTAMALLLLIFVPKVIYTTKRTVGRNEHNSSDSLRRTGSSSSFPSRSLSRRGSMPLDSEFFSGNFSQQFSSRMLNVPHDEDDDDSDGGAAIVAHPRLQQRIRRKNRLLSEENQLIKKRIKDLEREIRVIEQVSVEEPSSSESSNESMDLRNIINKKNKNYNYNYKNNNMPKFFRMTSLSTLKEESMCESMQKNSLCESVQKISLPPNSCTENGEDEQHAEPPMQQS